MSLEEGREVLRRADDRFGDRWWAPLVFVAALLGASVRSFVVRLWRNR